MNKFSNIRYALRHLFTGISLSHAYAHPHSSLCLRAVSDSTDHQDCGSRTGGHLPDVAPLFPHIAPRNRVIAPPSLALGPESGPGPAACGRRRSG